MARGGLDEGRGEDRRGGEDEQATVDVEGVKRRDRAGIAGTLKEDTVVVVVESGRTASREVAEGVSGMAMARFLVVTVPLGVFVLPKERLSEMTALDGVGGSCRVGFRGRGVSALTDVMILDDQKKDNLQSQV